MTRLSVFCASSTDGYLATLDDRLDWLDAAARDDEDYGYEAFIAGVDAVAMGRRTYDFVTAQVGSDGPHPWGARAVYVFTHRADVARDGVTAWACSPREALAHWEAQRHERVYVDGGELIAQFLAEGLIDDLTLTKVPVLLGAGRPLFPPIGRATSLRLDDVQTFPSGMVNLRYSRVSSRRG